MRGAPTPVTSGMPSDRATIAACAVAPLWASTMPAIWPAHDATSLGPRSSARTIAPAGGATPSPFASSPARRAMARRSAAREASVGSSRLASAAMCGAAALRDRSARGSAAGNGRAGRASTSAGSSAIMRFASTMSASASCPSERRRASQRVELGDDEREPALDARALARSASPAGRIVAVDAGPGGAERGARRRRVAAEGDLGHGASRTARSRAATTIATDVAPGSWCPTERSPRYEARPLRATIGTVARMPSSAAARAPGEGVARASPRRPATARSASIAGAQRVDHRLVAALGRAELDDRGERRLERVDERLGLDLLGVAERLRPALRKAGAPERAAGAADRRDERRAGGDQELARRRAAVQVVELDLDGGEPARHVRAVVGVADRRVELGEVVALLGDRRRAAAQPAVERLGGHGGLRHAAQAPQRSAAVLTGASQRPSSSSSSSSSVTEAPAISRLVM